MQEDEMKLFVQDRLNRNRKDGSSSFVLDPMPEISTDDGCRKTTGTLMDFLIEDVQKWQERLENYMEDEENDLSPDEWEALGESLRKFHDDVLKSYADNSGKGLQSMPSEKYSQKGIEAIKLLKKIKWKVSDAFDEIYFDDSEAEVKRILNKVVDKAVLLVEGGRPFERTEIDWVDPCLDREFNKKLYEFASADQVLPDAQAIPWLPPARQGAVKLLPGDTLKRLTTPLRINDIDDHEDWEYSVTHPSDEEESYTKFEGAYEQLRKNLKDVLTNEIRNYSNKVDTTASIDPSVVEIAAKRLEAGEIDVDFKSMFILPYDTNHCKLIGVRDDSVGDMITYKEVLKPPSERIMDQKLRNDPSAWFDPERSAGPRIRTFGWEPLADLEEDLPREETEVMKKKENPDALAAGSELSAVERERAEKLVQTLKEKCSKVIKEKKYDVNTIANPKIKDYLIRKGQRFGIIPDNFASPSDFLETLDMPKLREKDAGKPFPLDNEVIPLEPDWLGLDGSGPHEQLTEELYWKQLQSFKKPLSVPSVDWKSLLSEDVLENEDGAESDQLRRYLAEATEPQLKKNDEAEIAEPIDSLKVEKDTPARKRALDKEFVREWVEKFGDEEGIQGMDPKNFKPPEHLVSSEEYDEKFLCHPYTSSYVFHPNFVRFRRMTRNHPTYSEYTFKKLESASSSMNSEENAKEFKSIISNLETNGPQISADDFQPLTEKNLGVEPDEAKKWDLEFSTFMTEGLSRLESFAESSRSLRTNPGKACQEETSDSLLYKEVKEPQLPDFHKEFSLQPFTLEDFGNLPALSTDDNITEEKLPKKPKSTSPTSDSDSDSDESDDEGDRVVIRENISWRPFKEFNGYKNVNILQLLSDASQLIATTAPKRLHPPPKVMDWIQGKYQPNTTKLKKWRKLYGSLFPNVDSPLNTPYLFLSEEERLNRLRKPEAADVEDPDDPWALTKEEKIALKERSTKKADDVDNAQEETVDEKREKISHLEELVGISVRINKNDREWAEELDTSEAPDMSVLGTPAMEFMFKLDNFQKQAIMALEKGYNVFVSAHTSAGKTVVAEYAIAMSRKRRSRAIYTSPIKALSNQKYKDFKKCFESVGLITGDVQLNESADCLIMTTEILRSMLFNASEGIRDLEFVVLDEVHYMNDPERGHVWEEVLILLPANVQIVMLSATVPNTMEFASWVGRNKERKVMVCKTQHRPVPLKHYFYVDVNHKNPADGQFLLRDGDGPVRKDEWQDINKFIKELERSMREERRAVMRKLDEKRRLEGKKFKEQHHSHDAEDPTKTFGSGPNRQEMMKFYNRKEKAQWSKFITYLKDIEWLPTIVFAFSRKKCDELAKLLEDLDLTTPMEKLCIKAFIKSQVAKLDDEDRSLPQIKTLERHLARGVGVHHSGILPLLKEIVEFLFQEGKVKLLFATETFAMGVNMPARTVVFYSIKKFDGGEQRFLLPAEYIQMAGRAGRRGEDTVGNVIIRCPSRDAGELTIETIEAMMTGSPKTLTSQFRVSYRMILGTLTARSHITAENMMKQSYHENSEQKKYFQLEDALRISKDLESKQRTLIQSRYQKDYVEKFCQIYTVIDEYLGMWSQLREAELQSTRFLKEVQVGKLIKFRCGPVVSAIGVITKVTVKNSDFLVMGLRNFDQNAVLEPHPDMKDSTRWFKFLSVCPLPRHKPASRELDMRLIFYNVKVDDILEIYKDSVNVTEDNAALMIRNAQLSNNSGRFTGFPTENGPINPDLMRCLPTPNRMPFPFSQNATPYAINPGAQMTNVAANSALSESINRMRMNDVHHNSISNSHPSRDSPSPGNFYCPAQPLPNVLCGNEPVDSKEKLTGNPMFNNPLSFEFNSSESMSNPNVNERCNSQSNIGRLGQFNQSAYKHSLHSSSMRIPRQFANLYTGQPLMYSSPRAINHQPGPMHHPQVGVQNHNVQPGHCNMWYNRSTQNVPVLPSYQHPMHPIPKVNNLVFPSNNVPMVYLAGSSNVHNHQQHPAVRFIKPNPIQTSPTPVPKEVCKPPALENEIEFPKLGTEDRFALKTETISASKVSTTSSVSSNSKPLSTSSKTTQNITKGREGAHLALTESTLVSNIPVTSTKSSEAIQNVTTEKGNTCKSMSAKPNENQGNLNYIKVSNKRKQKSRGKNQNGCMESAVDELKKLSSKLDTENTEAGQIRCNFMMHSLNDGRDNKIQVGGSNPLYDRKSLSSRGNIFDPQVASPAHSNSMSLSGAFKQSNLSSTVPTPPSKVGDKNLGSQSLTQDNENSSHVTAPQPAFPSYSRPNFETLLSAGLDRRAPLNVPFQSHLHVSQVSQNPSNFLAPRPQPIHHTYYNPNVIHPPPAMFPPHFLPHKGWLHPQPPTHYYTPLVNDPRNKTKSDVELERICYKLHSPIGLKPVDEVSLAKDTSFELYQILKFKEEEMAASIDEFYASQTREDFVEAFGKIFKWLETVKGKDRLQKEVAEKTMTLYPEYASKMDILKTMNYVVEDSVQMKGYMAARVSKYELVITEMLVRNVIKDLTPEEVAGLMSFVVYQARTSRPQNDDSDEPVEIAYGLPNLLKAINNTKEIIREILCEEERMGVCSEELAGLIDSFNLTDIMYQWAKQKSFSTVISMTKDFQEGMLVRWIQQLVEALKEIESAARVMGDPAVPEKIQASIKSIKRGIVFSPSLYTTL